jgi:hypothetical protein
MRVASWVPPPENAMPPFGAMTSNLNGPLKVSPAWLRVTVERATTTVVRGRSNWRSPILHRVQMCTAP